MTDPLIRDLRVPKFNSASTMAEAADEIERLRNLIIAWVDADDRDIPFSSKYYDCTCQKEFCLASRALRRGVGR